MAEITLTKEQEARIPEWKEKWVEIGLQTGELNFEAAKEFAKMAYKAVDMEPPKVFLIADCPISAAVLANTLMEAEKPEDERDYSNVYDPGRIHSRLSEQSWGCHDAGWLSFYDFMIEVVGHEECRKMEGVIGVAKNCGWWAPYEEIVIFQHPPKEVHLDEQHRPHNVEGPAIAYRGGLTKMYAVHGVRLPEYVIERPEEITVEAIRKERNAEVRRIMRERYGDARYLRDTGARVLDEDEVEIVRGNPEAGTIKRLLVEDDDNSRWLVAPDGSTGRIYTLRVPRHASTCREAHEAICPASEDDILGES